MPSEAALPDVAERLRAIAERAGADLRWLPRDQLEWRYKAPGDLVTRADRISHEIVSAALDAQFPGVPQVMEEQENPDVLPGTYMVVDELDGTVVYANGMDEWGISIAYIDNGRPAAGVLHQPARGVTVVAARGHGVRLNGERIALSPARTLSNSVIGLEINGLLDEPQRAWMGRLAGAALATRTLATAVGSAIELLSGRTVLYVNCHGAKVWDIAAAVLAVEEAGGVASSLEGGPLAWSRVPMNVLLAANSNVSQAALALRAAEPA